MKGPRYQLQSVVCSNKNRKKKLDELVIVRRVVFSLYIQSTFHMKTDGLMKLIKSFSDMAENSCVAGEKGWVIAVDGAMTGVAFIKRSLP